MEEGSSPRADEKQGVKGGATEGHLCFWVTPVIASSDLVPPRNRQELSPDYTNTDSWPTQGNGAKF